MTNISFKHISVRSGQKLVKRCADKDNYITFDCGMILIMGWKSSEGDGTYQKEWREAKKHENSVQSYLNPV